MKSNITVNEYYNSGRNVKRRPSNMQGKRWSWGLLVVLILAFWLRLWRVGELALWYDEASFYWVASKPLVDVIAYTLKTSFEHPPFAFILYHFWIKFAPDNEFSLRFLAMSIGLLAIPLAWRLTKFWGSERLAFLVSVVFAFAPFGACFREARMYPVMFVLSLSSLLLFSSLLRNGYSAWKVLGLLTINGLAFFTHYYALWLILWEFMWLGLEAYKKKGLKQIIGGFALLFALIAGWFLASKGLRLSVSSVLGQPKLKAFVDIERAFVGVIIGGPLVEPIPLAVKVAVLLAWLSGLWGLRKTKHGLVWLSLIVFPIALSLAFPWSNINPRFFLYVLWPLALSWASQLQLNRSFLERIQSVFLLILLVSLWSYGWRLHFRLNSTENLYREALRKLEFMEKPGDKLLLYGPSHFHLLYYYYRGVLEPEKISLEEIYNLRQRAFVLGLSGWASDPKGEIIKALREEVYLAWENWLSDWVYLGLYYPPPALSSGNQAQFYRPESPYRLFLPLVLSGPGKPAIDGEAKIRTKEFAGGLSFTLTEIKSSVLHPYDAIYYTLCPSPPNHQIIEGLFFNVRLYDDEGKLWESQDYPIYSGCTKAAFVIPWGLPSGIYKAVAQVYDAQYGDFLRPVDGEPWLTYPILVQNDWPAKIVPTNPKDVTFGRVIQLLGTDKWPAEIEQGAGLPLTLYWFAPDGFPEGLERAVGLQGKRGELVASFESELIKGGKALKGLADRISLRIPGRLPPGRYSITLEVKQTHTAALKWEGLVEQRLFGVSLGGKRASGEVYKLGEIVIIPIPRSFRKPYVANPFEAKVEGVAKLLGYELDASEARPGGRLRLTLFWQATGEPEISYTVFTHLLGPDGKMWGQKDNPPAKGSRPTTTWVKGEYIADEYTIPVHPEAPEGTYTLYVGFYNPQTMERLPAFGANGERFPNDAIPIAKVEVARK
jgi:hypothetical protein